MQRRDLEIKIVLNVTPASLPRRSTKGPLDTVEYANIFHVNFQY